METKQMSLTNEEVLRKAAISAADALAAGPGKLNPEQSERFLDYVFDETSMVKWARTVRFRNEQKYIEKINIGRRAAVAATEGVDPGVRRGVGFNRVVLEPKEAIVPIAITDTFLEHNVEGKSATTHILQMFAKQLANDWELLSIHGNVDGPLADMAELGLGDDATMFLIDTYMSLFDGWLKQCESAYIVDHAGQALSPSLFRKMLSAMPSKFKKNKKLLRFYCAIEVEEVWRERVATRATALGDQASQSQNNLTPFGIELVPVALMQLNPEQVLVAQFSAPDATIQLPHTPILEGSVRIILESDAQGKVPSHSYEEGVDFTVDPANGTVTHLSGGDIPATTDLRIGYQSLPEILLTNDANLIVAIGRDISIEKARNIYSRQDLYAIHVKFDAKIEELTAVVKAKNIADTL